MTRSNMFHVAAGVGIALACVTPAAAAAGSPAMTVGQWDRFEIALTNRRTYADAYRDVKLTATFTAPDGRTVTCEGFHDGGRRGGSASCPTRSARGGTPRRSPTASRARAGRSGARRRTSRA